MHGNYVHIQWQKPSGNKCSWSISIIFFFLNLVITILKVFNEVNESQKLIKDIDRKILTVHQLPTHLQLIYDHNFLRCKVFGKRWLEKPKKPFISLVRSIFFANA